MTDDRYETDPDKPKLTPASENIWYNLATIAGAPEGLSEQDTIDKNRHFWNGYMLTLMSDEKISHAKVIPNRQLDPPKLKNRELKHIEDVLKKRGFPDLGLLKDQIDFSNLEIPNINFSGYLFPSLISFDNSTFAGWAVFDDTCFLEPAIFTNSKFVKNAFFNMAYFSNDLDFTRAKFDDGVDFIGATFTHSTVFFDSKFFATADFLESRFLMLVDFAEATFDGTVSFRETVFKSGLYFNETTFNTSPPRFFEAKVSDEISWTGTKFPLSNNISAETADSHKDAYERLALMMDRLKKHHDQHRFYRLETRVRREMEKKWSLPWIVNFGFEVVSDYGYGVSRAASFWVGNLFLGAILLGADKTYSFTTPTWDSIKLFCALTLDAMVTSFSNAHGFLGLWRGPLKDTVTAYQKNTDLIIPYNGIATVQVIFGAVFLFFLLLTLRNKFKMG